MRISKEKNRRTLHKFPLLPTVVIQITETVSKLALAVFAALKLDLDTGMNRKSAVIQICQITGFGPDDLLIRNIIMVLDRQHGMFFLKGYLRKAKGITEVETAVSRCILHFQDVRNRQGMSGKTDLFQTFGICFVRADKIR